MTGLVAVLFGLSTVLASELGLLVRDADSMASAAANAGAASLSASLSGLDPAQARSRVGLLDAGPACRAAQSAVASAARVTTCSLVGTDFVVVVITTDPPVSTATATVSLTERPRT